MRTFKQFIENYDKNTFADAILSNPNDTGNVLIFADWLEEKGDRRAELLRVLVALSEGRDVVKLLDEIMKRYLHAPHTNMNRIRQLASWANPTEIADLFNDSFFGKRSKLQRAISFWMSIHQLAIKNVILSHLPLEK